MRALIEYKDGRTEVYEDAGPGVYEGMLSLCGPECEDIGVEVPVSEVKRVVYVNSGEFFE